MLWYASNFFYGCEKLWYNIRTRCGQSRFAAFSGSAAVLQLAQAEGMIVMERGAICYRIRH